jgi:hypothetical protein
MTYSCLPSSSSGSARPLLQILGYFCDNEVIYLFTRNAVMFVAKALSPSNPRKYMRCGVAECIGGLFHLQLGRSFHVQYPYIPVSQSKMYPNGHALTLACPPFPLDQTQDPHAIRAMCFSSLMDPNNLNNQHSRNKNQENMLTFGLVALLSLVHTPLPLHPSPSQFVRL